MARGVNKAILIGNLGRDPEVRYSANGRAIANVRLATTRSWTNQQTNERQEETEWHTVVFFGRLAEIASEYLKKDSQVYVEGRLQTRKWQDQSGADRYTTEIVANDMQMLGSRSGAGAAPPADFDEFDQSKPASKGAGAAAEGDDFDDDIPF